MVVMALMAFIVLSSVRFNGSYLRYVSHELALDQLLTNKAVQFYWTLVKMRNRSCYSVARSQNLFTGSLPCSSFRMNALLRGTISDAGEHNLKLAAILIVNAYKLVNQGVFVPSTQNERMVKTILYATDLGLYGPFILEHVSELATCHQAKVVVVHAVEPLGVFADAVLEAYLPDGTKKDLKQHGLEEVLGMIRSQVKSAFSDDFIDYEGNVDWIADVRVVGGLPSDVILSEADECGADIIVLGSHGGRSKRSTPIGSVAIKVLQLAKVPVYLVPTSTQRMSG